MDPHEQRFYYFLTQTRSHIIRARLVVPEARNATHLVSSPIHLTISTSQTYSETCQTSGALGQCLQMYTLVRRLVRIRLDPLRRFTLLRKHTSPDQDLQRYPHVKHASISPQICRTALDCSPSFLRELDCFVALLSALTCDVC
jgi:hypothetical protein